MKRVGPALRDESHLPPAGTSLVGVGVAGGETKFLDGFQGDLQGRVETSAEPANTAEEKLLLLVVDVHAIQGKVTLVAAGARSRTTPDVIGVAAENHARLQAEQGCWVAGLERKAHHLLRRNHVAHR